jgi:hypothetical protein
MAGGVTMTIRDSGALRILKTYEVNLEVGILPEDADTKHEESGLTLGALALVHELGAGPIPARMPIRGWYADKSARMVKLIRKELETMVRTQTFIAGPLNAVAKEAERSLKGRIIAGLIDPPNAPRTLLGKKPEQRPLIGMSRQLLKAFRARITTTFGSGTVLQDD